MQVRLFGLKGFFKWRLASAAGIFRAMLAGCGGGGGTPGAPPVFAASSTLAATCAAPRPAGAIDPFTRQPYGDKVGTLNDEKNWVRSWIDETYLWYKEVPNLTATSYPTPVDYFNALKTPAITSSGKPKDQFHFVLDTAQWVALSQSGVEFGYGFELALLAATPPRKALIAYTEPNTPAAGAGIVRGAEILTVDGVNVVNDGTQAGVDTLNNGLFPTAAGTHTFTIRDTPSSGTREVTLNAGTITKTPVQNVKTLAAPNQTVGYLQFNDHIATSEQLLIDAINQLKTADVTDLVLDIRYNGGGYLDIASELAFMIAGPNTTGGKTFERLNFNDKNPFGLTTAQATIPFHAVTQGFAGTGTQNQSLPFLGLGKVFVLTGGGTCSASEAIVNGLRGVDVEVNLIGATTCGKPYGFFPKDNCSTTYFSIQFQGVNEQGFGEYADGFTPTCAVADDFSHALGDPAEGRLAGALTYRDTGTCPTVSAMALSAGRAILHAEPQLFRSPVRENRIYWTK
ncbi:MAG: S41 family peptidase [Pseudomonadota bacterium]